MATDDERIRVISWNVNGIRARWPRLEELLTEQQPDVVCLQETRCPDNRFPYGKLRDLGYEAQHSPGKSSGGVAILVRADHTVDASQPRARPRPQAGRGALAAGHDRRPGDQLRVRAGRLAGRGDRRQGKLAFLEAIARQVYGEQSRPKLITGDFNVAPTDQDVYEPGWLDSCNHTGEAEREGVAEIIAEGELVDVYRRLHPEERGYTCWDQREGHYARDYGLRIDLALASEHLTPYVTRCDVNHTYRQGPKPSNHAPLEIELDAVAA